MTPDAMVLAMRTMAPLVTGDLPPIALRLYDGRRPDPPVRDYRAAVTDGTLDVRAGAAVEPAATVTAESTVWSKVLSGDLPLAHAERKGTVRVEGDRDSVLRVVGLYAAVH